MKHSVVGILLAAGKSSRFGSNKLLHTLPDTHLPIALQAANNLLQALPHSIAVVRKDDLELKSLLSDTNIQIVDNPDADLGLSSSIRCAIQSQSNSSEYLQNGVTGYVLALADMPYIPVEIYQKVAQELMAGVLICAPQYNGKRGHPVGFSCKLSNELLALSGDKGAKTVVNKYVDQLTLVTSESNCVLKDIDTLNDVT